MRKIERDDKIHIDKLGMAAELDGMALSGLKALRVRQADTFPEPVGETGSFKVRLWLRSDFEAWKREHWRGYNYRPTLEEGRKPNNHWPQAVIDAAIARGASQPNPRRHDAP